MTDRSLCIGQEPLRDFVTRLFMARGMNEPDARSVAHVLVWADLRGGDTHGVSRVPHYFGMIDKGALKPTAVPRLSVDFGALVALDAGGAAGPVAMMCALREAQGRARAFGVGLALVGGATHAGAIGCYAHEAARLGFAAIILAAGPPLMAYQGARVPSVSTAPLAIAVPGGPDGVILLDMASSSVSNGRLKLAKRNAETLPTGWALDGEGRPATEAAKAEVLLPMGGPKGAGLALMTECLTSLLAGAPILTAMLGPGGKRGHGQNATLILIDIARLRAVEDFTSDIDALAQVITGLPRLEGVDAIRLPGARGAWEESVRARIGIPIARKVWDELAEIAKIHQIDMPEHQ